MSRCVPNWDLDDEHAPTAVRPRLSFLGPDLTSADSEVAELTWENGQLSLHGLGQTRLNSKPAATTGTLESLMNRAVPISGCKPMFACVADLIPWFEPSQTPTDVVAAASGTMMMDALVPCAAAASDDPRRQAMWLLADSTGHGDCREWGDHQSASGSATLSHRLTTLDACEHDRELDYATSECQIRYEDSSVVHVESNIDSQSESNGRKRKKKGRMERDDRNGRKNGKIFTFH